LGSNLSNYGDRLDADAVAFWEFRQLGAGERAIQREARSRVTQARLRQLSQMDRVAREVVEAHAQIAARARQIHTADEAVRAAESSYTKNWDRIQNLQGLPIEMLQSLQALTSARSEYVRVVADHNIAQFTLHRSLGWPVYSGESSDLANSNRVARQ
jgi:outer membrane protein TolC